jgi:hypothetical protein
MAPNMIEITINKVNSPYVLVKIRSKDFVINSLTIRISLPYPPNFTYTLQGLVSSTSMFQLLILPWAQFRSLCRNNILLSPHLSIG